MNTDHLFSIDRVSRNLKMWNNDEWGCTLQEPLINTANGSFMFEFKFVLIKLKNKGLIIMNPGK